MPADSNDNGPLTAMEVENVPHEQEAAQAQDNKRPALIVLAAIVSLLVVIIAVRSMTGGEQGGGGGGASSPSPSPEPEQIKKYLIQQLPCDMPSEDTGCAALVKRTVADLDGRSPRVSDKHLRIGEVLGANMANGTHAKMCCEKGTDFDRFLLQEVDAVSPDQYLNTINKDTALLVVDLQQDFTDGAFGQSCWSSGGSGFSKKIADLATFVAEKGGTVIASKDFHPSDHCSFAGPGASACKNTKDSAEELSSNEQYVNDFPSHCTYQADDSGKNRPQRAPETPFCKAFGDPTADSYAGPSWCKDSGYVGTSFESAWADALAKLPQDRVEVIFKGFDKTYESFSAFSHQVSSGSVSDEEIRATGGYALPLDRSGACHGKWDTDDCYPTQKELADRGNDGGARKALDILKSRNIKRLIVVGLVYDFCVSESAIFAKEDLPSLDIQVLGDLTRPSFDGKPGAPYKMPADALRGGGTADAFRKIQSDLVRNRITLQRFATRENPKCRMGDQYFAIESPCTEINFQESFAGVDYKMSKCEQNIRTTLGGMGDVSRDREDLRIDTVLTTPGDNFEDGCCRAGTEFDKFVQEGALPTNTQTFLNSVDKTSALFIVDMQRDLVNGAVGTPCWSVGGNGFSRQLASLIRGVASKGATVIASKDLHPPGHCSFNGNADSCENAGSDPLQGAQGKFKNDASHCTFDISGSIEERLQPQAAPFTEFCENFPGDPMNAADYKGPSFCTHSEFLGAAFDPRINTVLSGVQKGQMEVVFKGFIRDYNSFSIFPGSSSDTEANSTGGWALPQSRADACHKDWDGTECYPTQDEVDARGQSDGLRPIWSILQDRGIKKAMFTGMGFDFAVVNSAVAAMASGKFDSVTILIDHTRPLFDGKPGAPYTSGDSCDSTKTVQDDFCDAGGGTLGLFQSLRQVLKDKQVSVQRLDEDACREASAAFRSPVFLGGSL